MERESVGVGVEEGMIARFDLAKKKQKKRPRDRQVDRSPPLRSWFAGIPSPVVWKCIQTQNAPGPGILAHRGHFQHLCLSVCLKTPD